MTNLIAKLLISLGALVLIAALGLGLAFPIKWCWNYVMPYLFNLKEITWGQAWCLHFVAGSLIKSTMSTTTKS